MYLLPTILCSILDCTWQKSHTKPVDAEGYLPIKLIEEGRKRELRISFCWLNWKYTYTKQLT